ncbi:uncharacterized protein LOC134538182 [Bacillus rossius redtenbacheri]|uniref:uncharacterized protein LOC134538182 n=1 Tax=Bacillus rossius redtenbacheri TaxID=93214 RepID=UPI002FDD18E9
MKNAAVSARVREHRRRLLTAILLSPCVQCVSFGVAAASLRRQHQSAEKTVSLEWLKECLMLLMFHSGYNCRGCRLLKIAVILLDVRTWLSLTLVTVAALSFTAPLLLASGFHAVLVHQLTAGFILGSVPSDVLPQVGAHTTTLVLISFFICASIDNILGWQYLFYSQGIAAAPLAVAWWAAQRDVGKTGTTRAKGLRASANQERFQNYIQHVHCCNRKTTPRLH